MEEGDFTVELSEMLTKRKDEIGQMAGTAVRMQHSLRDLVQRDSLTGLYNRHYGEIWMKQVKEEARDTGEPFSIAIQITKIKMIIDKRTNNNIGTTLFHTIQST